MWAAKDNGSNLDWVNAQRYCEKYRGRGYTDWRMPTPDELAGLYDESKTYKSDRGTEERFCMSMDFDSLVKWMRIRIHDEYHKKQK